MLQPPLWEWGYPLPRLPAGRVVTCGVFVPPRGANMSRAGGFCYPVQSGGDATRSFVEYSA